MVTSDITQSDADFSMSIAEACQFLSTLLVLFPMDGIDVEKRQALSKKLKNWCRECRGKFCETTAQRCLDMLEPKGRSGTEMRMMLPMMRQHLAKGVQTCNLEGCSVGANGDETVALQQCSRCAVLSLFFEWNSLSVLF